MNAKSALVALAAALSLSACGADVAGYWNGSWTSQAGQSGTLALGLRQDGSELTGTFSNTSPACQIAGTFLGEVDGNRMTGTATNARADADAEAMRFEMEGEVAEDGASISGSYTITGESSCAGEKGNWKLTR